MWSVRRHLGRRLLTRRKIKLLSYWVQVDTNLLIVLTSKVSLNLTNAETAINQTSLQKLIYQPSPFQRKRTPFFKKTETNLYVNLKGLTIQTLRSLQMRRSNLLKHTSSPQIINSLFKMDNK